MNLKICDVCHEEGKIEKATWKIGLKMFRIDSCDNHKNFFNGIKSINEAFARFDNIKKEK